MYRICGRPNHEQRHSLLFPVQVGEQVVKRTTHCGMSTPYVPYRSVARRQTPYR